MRDAEASPLVSVIMIFRNAAGFMEDAIESVYRQSLSGWELLLVDDASEDGSTAIARQHAAQRPEQVFYLRHPDGENHGLSSSRNLGLRHARGEFVAFLDADDLYLPSKLESQVGLLHRYATAQMVYGPTRHWFSWTGRPEDRERDQPKRLGVAPNRLVSPPELVPLYLSGEAQTPGTSGFLVRRTAALAVGGFEESFRTMSEDAVFLYKVALRYDVYVEGETRDLYRQHPDSLSNDMRRQGQYRASGPSPLRLQFLTWLEGYLEAQGIGDDRVKDALRKQLRQYRNPILRTLSEARYRARGAWKRMTRGLRLS
jgi:hypothetical protein